MAAKKVKVIYQDETHEPEIVKILPRAQVTTEGYLKGFTLENIHLANFHLAWAALNTLRKTDLDFETWLNTVEDVEDYEDPEKADEPIEEIPPTQPVQSGAVSSE